MQALEAVPSKRARFRGYKGMDVLCAGEKLGTIAEEVRGPYILWILRDREGRELFKSSSFETAFRVAAGIFAEAINAFAGVR